MLNTTKFSDAAFNLGRAHGVNAGSWVIDGNTTRETAENILRGYNDGDPKVMDIEPSPLSGEWADSMTPDKLAEAIELPEEYRGTELGTELDQLSTDYELGFSEGFWHEVIESARYIIRDDCRN